MLMNLFLLPLARAAVYRHLASFAAACRVSFCGFANNFSSIPQDLGKEQLERNKIETNRSKNGADQLM